METKRRYNPAILALAGIGAGLVLLLADGDILFAGITLVLTALTALNLTVIKKWLTDTTYERERLRHAILNADEAAQLAQVGRAIQMAERERDRRIAEEARQEAANVVRAARAQMDQHELNLGMRAHAFEETCEAKYDAKLAAGIAAAEARADAAIAAVKLEFSNKRTSLMVSQFVSGVQAERASEVDAILAAMEDPKLIRLDDHRRPDPEGRAAEGR